MAAETRLAVLKAFQANGLLLDKEALSVLSEYTYSIGGSQEVIMALIEGCQADDKLKIGKAEALDLVSRQSGSGRDAEFIQVISAFEVPPTKFDPIRKAFYHDESRIRLFADALDKRAVYLERLHVLQQRLARNPLFSRPVFGDLSRRDFVELTEIKALLGSVGQTRTVMGFISQLEDGQYYIEDLSGALKVDLSEAMTAAGFYVENCIVAAEGHTQHNGIFKVTALGMPPNESREESVASAKGLRFFGGTELEAEDYMRAIDWEADHPEDRVVIVSDVWLDHPAHLTRLEAILSGAEIDDNMSNFVREMDDGKEASTYCLLFLLGFESLEQLPSLFILMGNFHSYSCASASTDYAAVKSNFASLATLISQHARLMEHSRLVFVPGPGDPGPATVLPRPPLPAVLTQKLREALPNAVFATNPCRIRYYSQEIVVFRDDSQKRMRQLCLRPPVEGDSNLRSDMKAADSMFEHLAMTVTQQSHLCPVPLENQAVYWQMDHSLRLYPLPHALVLADSAPAADFVEKKSGCICINPGSMRHGSFAAYKPSSHEAELCDVPEVMD